MKCPNCKKPVKIEENPFAPFCSERCKLIDLGAWLDEKYSVPGAPIPAPPEGPPQETD